MATAPSPTWDVISTYFRPEDIACMQARGLDLTSCADVIKHAKAIYSQVTSGNMPLGGTPWSKEWCDNFYAWWHSTTPCPSS